MDNNISKLISIIVPVYRIKEEFLRKCMESLLNQGRDDYEIILIDDGSPDNCGAICDEYALQNNSITVIHQENAGVSEARNNGMRAVKTKWLTFVDADDWIVNDYITSLYAVIGGEALDADIVMFDYIREYKDSQSKENMRLQTGYLTPDQLDIVHRAPFYKFIQDGKFNPYTVIGLWDKVYKTEFLRNNDIWFVSEARKGQDRLFNADALNSTDKIYYLNRDLYYYRCWEQSRTNRYDPCVPELTVIEITHLKLQAEKHSLQSTMDAYIKSRTCTRLYVCMRLYFFHADNDKPYKKKIEECKAFVNRPLFKDALNTVDITLLNSQEKVFVYVLKANLYSLVYFLVKVRTAGFRKKLN